MRLVLTDSQVERGSFHLQVTGIFSEGVHLIWGPVGCGKTTLSLLLAGLLPSDKGEMIREGIDRVGLLMQFPEYQITSQTLIEEVESWRAPGEFVLRELGLWDHREVDPLTLSRGELKRFLLSTLVHAHPDLLLLDEPFAGMDCCERKKMIELLGNSSSRIIILFSHDQDRLLSIHHLWEMKDGALHDRGAVQGSEVSPVQVRKG